MTKTEALEKFAAAMTKAEEAESMKARFSWLSVADRYLQLLQSSVV